MDLGQGKKHRTVIQGEASESDEDDDLGPSPLRSNDTRIPIPSYQVSAMNDKKICCW